jgi:hypothetical protein
MQTHRIVLAHKGPAQAAHVLAFSAAGWRMAVPPAIAATHMLNSLSLSLASYAGCAPPPTAAACVGATKKWLIARGLGQADDD